MTSRGKRDWSGGAVPLIAPEHLSDIIATAADVSIVISDSGQILSVLVNPNHRSFGTLSHWEGRDIRDVLTVECVPKIDTRLAAFARGAGDSRAIELIHADGGDWEFPIRYSFHQIAVDGALLMLGRDLRPIAEMQQQLVRAQLALERDYEVQRDYDTRFRVLMEVSPEPLVFVALKSGRVSELNSAATMLLGADVADLAGSSLSNALAWAGTREFHEIVAGTSDGGTIEATCRRTGRKLLLSPTVFRSAGERVVLLQLAPATRDAEAPGGLADPLRKLYEDGVEAIVFADRSGTIVTANEAFLNLVDAADLPAVRGHSLGDFLGRGAVDLRVLIENAQRSGRMKLYAAKATSIFGSQTAVEISATWLDDRGTPAIAFVLRDASRADAARTPGPSMRDEDMRSIRELVGSATLKDIVTETTDVIEKMCIETAVELTGNNRVAAADMLGLSRQSLYVKLRKYGLLSREVE